MLDADVIVIGGGLAGLVSAIHLSSEGKSVILFEKDAYPHHKVCGEYISNEVLSYLKSLNCNPEVLHPSKISRFEMTTPDGAVVHSVLPLGGFGVSRYTLDHFLQEKAIQSGASVIIEQVIDVEFNANVFTVSTENKTYKSKIVLGAYGKRATLDVKFDRSFIKEKSSWLAVKAHYRGDFPNDLVALYHFKGGYCGVSKVEDNLINICYLVNYSSFKKFKNIQEHQEQVLYKNKQLKAILQKCSMHFEAPLTISQISFEKKECVKNHILMVGDTAGLIHPLCGNGMGMAIHGAKIASELVLKYLDGEISSTGKLEEQYAQVWQKTFKTRLRTGRLLSSLLRKEKLSNFLINRLAEYPLLIRKIIKQTHGKPII